MKPSRTTKILFVIILVLIAPIFVLSLYKFYMNFNLLAFGNITTGKIEDITRIVHGECSTRLDNCSVDFLKKISYIDAKEQSHFIETEAYGNLPFYKLNVGDTVKLIYSDKTPDKAVIYTPVLFWLYPLIGFLLVLAAIYINFRFLNHRKFIPESN